MLRSTCYDCCARLITKRAPINNCLGYLYCLGLVIAWLRVMDAGSYGQPGFQSLKAAHWQLRRYRGAHDWVHCSR